jgi:Domain of unknown function (DUF5666)
MKLISLSSRRLSSRSVLPPFLILISVMSGITSGCFNRPGPPPPAFQGNTNLTLLLSSTANDQLIQFNVGLTSLSLTNKAGKTFSLFNTTQNAEFIHLNGGLEPLLTVSVPEGVYVGLNATFGASQFTCAAFNSSAGGVTINGYEMSPSPVTVNLPAPITITGSAVGLLLDLLVSQSAVYPSTCYFVGTPQYSITPSFTITPLSFSSPPTNSLNEFGLDGEISSLNAAENSFSLVLVDGQTISVNANDSTVYQGVSGFSLLAAGIFIDMDATIQADGSQLATHIAVEDADPTNLSVSLGPLSYISSAEPSVSQVARQNQGYLATSEQAFTLMSYGVASASFQISGQLTNLQTLPFAASFDSNSIFDGQNVYISTHALTGSPIPANFPATTITLMPQAVNGTISGISSDGDFTVYAVTLAAYDSIPVLPVQGGQTIGLTNPSTIFVYVDSNTQMLNTESLTLGSVARFYGLLFNDNGAARMDCARVFNGVAE